MNTCFNGNQTQFLSIDGLSNRSADSADGDDHVLEATPWQESLFAFEPTRAQRPKHTHLVAVDLSRFGPAPGPRYSGLTWIQAVCAALSSAVAPQRLPSSWATEKPAALATRWWERRWRRDGLLFGEQVRVRALADSLRAEQPALRVTSVRPGRIDAPMQHQLVEFEDAEYDETAYLRPETVAGAIAQVVAAPPDAHVHQIVIAQHGDR